MIAGGCAEKIEDDEGAQAPPASTSQQAQVAATPAKLPAKPLVPQPHDPVPPKLEIVELDNGGVAIDLHAESWPGRALDPHLTIGQLKLTEYEHPSKQVLRFFVPDASALVAGAEVVLQYGDDASSRVVVTQALEVTR